MIAKTPTNNSVQEARLSGFKAEEDPFAVDVRELKESNFSKEDSPLTATWTTLTQPITKSIVFRC